MGAPVRFQKAVPRTKEKRRGEAPIGAPVRVMGRPFPSAEGTGFAVRLSHRVRRSAPALVGASPPSDGGTFPKGGRAPAPPERWRSPIERQTRSMRAAPCLQPDNSTQKWRAFWRNEPKRVDQ